MGGGTGTYTVLLGLKKYPVELTAVVSMADSGGSNRVLRDEFGLLPTSDIRQALVALADDQGDQEIFRQLFAYRFHQGVGITGMTFGNLFMAALADIYHGSQLKAIEETAKILHVKGRVLPVTLEDIHLLARYENGHQVVGEHYIDEPRHDGRLRIVELETIPLAQAYPPVLEAIREADLVVLGPGDLYTSIIPNFLIHRVVQALVKTRAKLVLVMNLMSRYGQSYRFTARDFIAVVDKYLGRRKLDVVVLNRSKDLPQKILRRYAEENSFPVKDDLGDKNNFQVVRADLLSPVEVKKVPGDQLTRSLLRHDSFKLAKTLVKLL